MMKFDLPLTGKFSQLQYNISKKSTLLSGNLVQFAFHVRQSSRSARPSKESVCNMPNDIASLVLALTVSMITMAVALLAVMGQVNGAVRRAQAGSGDDTGTRQTPRRVSITFTVDERILKSSQRDRLWM